MKNIIIKIFILLLVLPCFSFAQDTSCPIKIIKYKLSKDEIQTNQISLVYENTSGKDIDALTFTVSCFNNFNEPVNAGLGNNKFSGISQTILKSGHKERSAWTLYLFDNATKVDTPIITKVHFTDGTTWQSL